MVLSLIFLFFAWTGWTQLRRPAAFAARRKKKAASEPGEQPISPGEVRRVRISGALWLLTGVAGFAIVPMQLDYRSIEIRQLSGARSEQWTNVARQVQQFVSKHSIPSLAIAVVTPEDEAFFGFGKTSVLRTRKVDEHTVFEIGSITKTFTGSLLAKMIQEGKVTLEQPVISLLPAREWSEQHRKIWLRHLTTHTAGLPRMPPGFFTPWRMIRAAAELDPYRGYTEEELLDAFAGMRADELKPGAAADYSNFGVALLGVALARQCGGTYEEAIRREICLPLGMENTSAHLTESQAKLFVRGYSGAWRLGPFWLLKPAAHWQLPNAFAGAGALRSSASDMALYLKAAMGRGESPLKSAFAEARKELAPFAGKNRIGMNWIRAANEPAQTVIWHNGGTGGFHSFLGFTEDGRFGVVLLSGSTDDRLDSLGMDLLKMLREQADTSAAR